MNRIVVATAGGWSASEALKAGVLAFIVTAALAWGLFFPAVVQSQAYHRFADTRTLLGIVNAFDTL
ncbi:MAG: hypothetical protein JSW68_02425, partial [Burkholderiales bacterium]